MLNTHQVKATQFFQANAGGIVGRNAITAISLMRAERHAEDEGWSFHWEFDYDLDTSWMDERQLKDLQDGNLESVQCLLKDSNGNALASLSGIVMGLSAEDQNYRRVVEAELASEGMALARCHVCGRVQ